MTDHLPKWLPSKKQLIDQISAENEENYWRFLYWQQIPETFMAVVGFESATINAMTMCNDIVVEKRLGHADSSSFKWMRRRENLEGSTLGSLIKILENHEFRSETIGYLRWVKSRRDYFIHKHFIKTPWPGDLDPDGCYAMIRRLRYIEKTMDRAAFKIWRLFEGEGLLIIKDLGEAGQIMSSSSMWTAK